MKGLPDEIFDDKKTIFGTSTLKQKRLAALSAWLGTCFMSFSTLALSSSFQFEQY
jgi:hypothetical protein